MTKTIKPKLHCVETASKGMFWIPAFSKADALAQWAQRFPKTPAKKAWRSSRYKDELPVDRVFI
jgi:hypothetical protein